MFFTYILYSLKSGKYYIGSTNNLLRRFHEHQHNQEAATKNHGPWEMVYWESCVTLSQARRRELYLKSGAGYRWRVHHCAAWFNTAPPR